ncbi:MAG: hypothetical protein U9N55_06825 [candidate division Zixibacteria bacterium]|nr:hypothetical protein [candidate division Zixibacteria bacterium]
MNIKLFSSKFINLKNLYGRQLLIILIPFSIYLFNTSFLSDWIIDDAGITYAYAKNLAHGYGLVSQPGVSPVEGYSNFLWLLLMVPFFWINIFHPYITVKAISFICVLLTYIYLHFSIKHITNKILPSFIVLIYLSLNTSYLVWTCSGLENPLLGLIGVILLFHLLKIPTGKCTNTKNSIKIGLIVSIIGLTRPDGIMYSLVFPTYLLYLFLFSKLKYKNILCSFISYISTVILLIGAFIVFRYLYFGQFYPNTYYVKGGPTISKIIKSLLLQDTYLTKMQVLVSSLFGNYFWLITILTIILSATILIIKKVKRDNIVILLIITYISLLTHILMPNDWMGEFRFATLFIIYYYCILIILITLIIDLLIHKFRYKAVITVLIFTILLGGISEEYYSRFRKFIDAPVVAFEGVKRYYSDRFDNYSDKLNLTSASILLPDIGATLFYSKLKVYDLVGLTDPVIAKILKRDKKRFYDYVFKEIKPTFIHIHGNWTFQSNFDSDPRFRMDYVPISEYKDTWIKDKTNKDMMSGDFIRKDVIIGKEDILENL